jgi:hypothetical protein
MTIIQTAKKPGVNPSEYIHDHITHDELERLAGDLLKQIELPT